MKIIDKRLEQLTDVNYLCAIFTTQNNKTMLAIIHSEKGAYAHLNGKTAKTRNDHGVWQFFDEEFNVWVDTRIERLSFQHPGLEVFYKIMAQALAAKNRYIDLCGIGVAEKEAMNQVKDMFLVSIEWPQNP